MEKMNLVSNGLMRLPPGFRFHPTDEELVVQYLKRKVFSCPLPASIIPEIDVCKYDPWDLPGEMEREKYFFTTLEVKHPNQNRLNRATGSGYWKATGKDKQILASRSNQVIGTKKILVFYRGKPPNLCKTDWIMHEYRLPEAGSRACIFPQRKNSTQSSMLQMEDWVLCRIFMKKRIAANGEIAKPGNKNRVGMYGVTPKGLADFAPRQIANSGSSPLSTSSDSSSITELSSSTSAGSEENSSC